MTDYFYLELINDTSKETMSIKFEVCDTALGRKWFQQLKKVITASPNHIKYMERDRLYDFPNNKWSEQSIVDRINHCIDEINNYKHFIDIRAQVGGDQDHHNKLHKYFELMRGTVANGNEFFLQAPDNIKAFIEDYNVTIHRYESFNKNQENIRKNKQINPYMMVTFDGDQRYPMEGDDFDQCTMVTNFGDVFLNYCEVGKHFLEVYYDQDEIVGDKSIIPFKYYSAGMWIKFFKNDGIEIKKGFDSWWDTKEKYFNELGFFKGDKTLSIGYILVAKLVSDIPESELLEQIGNFDAFNRVYID